VEVHAHHEHTGQFVRQSQVRALILILQRLHSNAQIRKAAVVFAELFDTVQEVTDHWRRNNVTDIFRTFQGLECNT
jgi:hypothetical protein